MKKTILLNSFLALAGSLALAGAPKSTLANPGYYRFSVGLIQVTTISDGTLQLTPLKQLTGSTEKNIKAHLKSNFLTDVVETSINTYLVNTGEKLVLIDTGAGKMMGPSGGHLLENLSAAGYKPEQIDMIVITHAHPDHIGGLTSEGKISFPNATVFMDKKDVDFFLDPQNLEKAPKEMKPYLEFAVANISPYQKAGKLTAFTQNTEITKGVTSLDSHGHTPGHNSYVVESNGEKLVLIGDLLHVASVQFSEPKVGMVFDADSKLAGKYRGETFKDAAAKATLIGAAHIAFPGVGHVRKEKVGFTFVPTNYQR
jgi:glyoxylase-like metal-dependent hydrolase (beta-lactamase superfamily II)